MAWTLSKWPDPALEADPTSQKVPDPNGSIHKIAPTRSQTIVPAFMMDTVHMPDNQTALYVRSLLILSQLMHCMLCAQEVTPPPPPPSPPKLAPRTPSPPTPLEPQPTKVNNQNNDDFKCRLLFYPPFLSLFLGADSATSEAGTEAVDSAAESTSDPRPF